MDLMTPQEAAKASAERAGAFTATEVLRTQQRAALEAARGMAMASANAQSQWAKDILKATGPSTPVGTRFTGPPMIALIDGDLIAYRSAAATQGTYYKVRGPKIKGTVEHKYYRDALKAALIAEGYTDKAKAYITKHKNPEPVSHSIHNMAKILAGTKDAIEQRYKRPVEFEVFLTADVLFRDDIEPLYKSSRKGNERPENLKASKEWLEKTHGAMTVPGYEADDLLSIYATDLGPTDCVIVSLDKDLRQIPGEHYDFSKGTFDTIDKYEAKRNFWRQCLEGDATDDIPGIKGVGPVTANRILEALDPESTHHDFYKVVLKAWINETPRLEDESDTEFYTRIIQLLSKSAKLLWLSREPEDIWSPPVTGDSNKVKAKDHE